MSPEAWAFGAAALLAAAGTIIAIGGLAAVQQTCNSSGDAGPQTHTLIGVGCSVFLSYYWVTVALQAAFLLSAGAAIATAKVHTFRATLYMLGGVCVALGIVQSWAAYRLMQDLPAGALYNRWAAFIAGAAIYSAGTILLSFTGDAMYRALRIERRDGYVTFRRLPSKWEARTAEHSNQPENEGDGSPDPGQAGWLNWAFLASLALALAGTCVALGGTASLQAYCAENGFIEHFHRLTRRMVHCDAYLAILWVAFAFQVAFMAVTGWAWRAKAIHNFRTSLWALAAVATALACHSNFLLYLLATKTTGLIQTRYTVSLVGFCCVCGGDFLLIIIGDAMYRLKHEEGADGFISLRRPGPAAPTNPAGISRANKQWRASEIAFLASITVAFAGTLIALGGAAGAQASCNTEEAGPDLGALCQTFSYPWWTVALQMFVLGATMAAWLTDNVNNFRASLWALVTVAIHNGSMAAYGLYSFWQGGALTGSHRDSVIVLVYGLSIAIAGDFLFTATGDVVFQLWREEGRDGAITFRRPHMHAPPEAAPAQEMADGRAGPLRHRTAKAGASKQTWT